MEDQVLEDFLDAVPEKLRSIVLMAKQLLPAMNFEIEAGDLTMDIPGEASEECHGFAFSQRGDNVTKHGCAYRVIVAIRSNDNLIFQVSFPSEPPRVFMKPIEISTPDHVAALIRMAMLPMSLAS